MLNRNGASEKEEFWRLAVDEWRESGLKIRAFCKREQLSEPAFYSWRRKIQLRDSERGDLVPRAEASPAKFVPVEVVQERSGEREIKRTDAGSDSLEITTPGGMRLRCGDWLAEDRMVVVLASMLRAESGAESC